VKEPQVTSEEPRSKLVEGSDWAGRWRQVVVGTRRQHASGRGKRGVAHHY